MRAAPEDRPAKRQPVDADVEERADEESQDAEREDESEITHDAGPAEVGGAAVCGRRAGSGSLGKG